MTIQELAILMFGFIFLDLFIFFKQMPLVKIIIGIFQLIISTFLIDSTIPFNPYHTIFLFLLGVTLIFSSVLDLRRM